LNPNVGVAAQSDDDLPPGCIADDDFGLVLTDNERFDYLDDGEKYVDRCLFANAVNPDPFGAPPWVLWKRRGGRE
jgi:hypothetical protein